MADTDLPITKLNARQLAFVSAYLGDARFNATKAALSAGYSEKTAYSIGARLLKDVEIQEAIQAWRDLVKSRGIATLEYRLNRLDDMEQRCWRIVAERGEALGDDARASGGASGFIVKQHKIIGGGENAQFVTEYVFDGGLSKEIRAIYDDAAKEMGQRIEKSETKLDATESFIASLREFGRAGNA